MVVRPRCGRPHLRSRGHGDPFGGTTTQRVALVSACAGATRDYEVAGATEGSAMASSEDAVQNLRCTATCLQLLASGGKPSASFICRQVNPRDMRFLGLFAPSACPGFCAMGKNVCSRKVFRCPESASWYRPLDKCRYRARLEYDS